MKKRLKFAAYGALGLIAVVLVVVGMVAATFNPNDYKPLIVKLVQEKKQRTLDLEGDIKLTFWPKLGADLGKVTLSEHNDPRQFASIQSAKVSLALLPLLKKELVVDTVYIDGLNVTAVRHKDGTSNFDDLISKDQEESEQIKFDIDGVRVSNTEVRFIDEMQDSIYSLKRFNLKTGHVALARPFDIDTSFDITASKPQISASIELAGNFMADVEAKHYIVKGLDANISGNLASLNKANISLVGNVDAKPENMELLVDGLKFALKGNQAGAKLALTVSAPKLTIQKNVVTGKQADISFSQEKGRDVTKAKLTLADVKGSPQSLQSSGITGEISTKQGARNVQGKFSSPFSGNLEKMMFDLAKLTGNLDITDPALPKGAIKGEFALNLHADIKQQLINSDYLLHIDDTQLKGNVGLASFSQPAIKFNLNANQLNLNKLLGNQPASNSPASDKPTDLGALKSLLLDGNVNVGKITYDKYQLNNLSLAIKANGEQLNIANFAVKFDESAIQGSFGISQFAKPLYHFDLDIDKFDADKYITKSDKEADKKSSGETPIDLSGLKTLNAEGDLRLGSLKVANVKTSNVRLKLKAKQGIAELAPFSAKLYEGSMNGSLKVDARNTPSIAFKQNMTSIAIGPLMVDAINNDMLNGKGTLNLDISTQGNTVSALKKSLNGTASVALADGAVKGIDIAGTLRSVKDKLNIMKQSNTASDKTQKTDFSEMSATFAIKNGVAHNEDLSMKAPLFRIGGNGDIDIGNETINYTAKPTIVNSLKGQGGSDLSLMNGLTIPVKVTGSFAKPSYGIDFSGLAAGIAKNKLLEGVGGAKGDLVRGLVGGGNKADIIKGLIGGNKNASPEPATAGSTATPAPAPAPTPTLEEKAKKKLNKLLGF